MLRQVGGSVARSRPWQAITSRPHLPIAAYLTYTGYEIVTGHSHGSLDVVPTWLGWTWALMLTIGGVLAVLGGLAMAKRTETAGLVMMLVGSLIFGAVFGVAFWRTGQSDGVIANAVAIALMCLIRIRALRLRRRRDDAAAEVIKSNRKAGR